MIGAILIRRMVFVVIALLVAGVVLFAISPMKWHSATPYPFAVAYDQVVVSGNYIYVLGAGLTTNGSETNMTYYAKITQNGILNWVRTTDTPASIIFQNSCVTYKSKAYCIGSGDSSYFANLSPTGVGPWSKTTAYPENVTDAQCFNQGNLMCCVGGMVRKFITNNTRCAFLTDTGIGAWTNSTSYPIKVAKQRMIAYNGYVYSIGGLNRTLQYTINGKFTLLYAISNSVYYAKITSSGVGSWIKTTDYPYATRSIGLTAYNGHIYGIGGLNCTYTTDYVNCATLNETYYAALSSSGIGAWSAKTPYPFAVFHEGCAQVQGELYCIGGMQTNVNEPYSNVYYTDLS